MPAADCTSKLKALADETRWRIVNRLVSAGRANVTTLARDMKIGQPSASKHLGVLREAGIVDCEKEGTIAWYRIAPEFLHRLRSGDSTVDFGCCTFRFERRGEV